jgi:uncharacterized protein (TIGR00369 family)
MREQVRSDGMAMERGTRMPIARTLGFHFTRRGNGTSELVQPVTEAITFDGVAVQAGAVATIADFAGGAAVSSLLPPDWRISTADMTVKLLAPAIGERLIARGQALQTGKTISVARADVFAVAGGVETLCATALVTLRNSPPAARAAA